MPRNSGNSDDFLTDLSTVPAELTQVIHAIEGLVKAMDRGEVSDHQAEVIGGLLIASTRVCPHRMVAIANDMIEKLREKQALEWFEAREKRKLGHA